VSSGEERARLKGNEVGGLAVAPGGGALAVLAEGEDGVPLRLWNTATGKPLPAFKPLAPRWGPLAFSGDGRFLTVAGRDRIVEVLSATTGAVLCELPTGERATTVLAFSPDSRTVALANATDQWEPEGTVTLWELSSGKKRWESPTFSDGATALAFSPDGLALASGHSDGDILLWDVAGRLRTRGSASPVPSSAELERLWTDLASSDARRAYRAMRALASMPTAAVTLLCRRRMPTTEKGLDRLRALRAVEVLEWIGTAKAKRALASLAKGRAGALLTREANVALGRLERRAR
jgi:WD domain, G-beta repeat